MGFIIMCGVFACIIQLILLFHVKKQFIRIGSILPLEVLPVGAALYYAITQPATFFFGWEFQVVMYLWIAGAILAGYLAGWLIYSLMRKYY